MTEAAKIAPNGSTIAGIEVNGLTEEEVLEKLTRKIKEWQSQEDLIAQDEEEKVFIPRALFEFDMEASITQLKEATNQKWYAFFLKKQPKHIPLTVRLSAYEADTADWPNYIDKKATLLEAREEAASLTDEAVQIVYERDDRVEKEVVAQVSYSVPQLYASLERLIHKVDGQKIEANSEFSLIESVLEQVSPSVPAEEVNLFATALYELSLKTNMDVLERHSQKVVPSYAKAGIEVAVNKGKKQDFVLYNPDAFSYLIEAEIKNSQLVLALQFIKQEMTHDYIVENIANVKPRTVYRYNYKLPYGARQYVDSGKEGKKVEIYRVRVVDGETEEKELMSRDYYPSSPKIVVLSSKEPPEEINETNGEKALEETLQQLLTDREDISEEGVQDGNDQLDEEQQKQTVSDFIIRRIIDFLLESDEKDIENLKQSLLDLWKQTEFTESELTENLKEKLQQLEQENEEK